MEEFRFHMTLTGRLDAERREPVVAMAEGIRFSATGLTTLPIDRIAISRQDSAVASRFRIASHWTLRARDA